jgi:hypothetical protein
VSRRWVEVTKKDIQISCNECKIDKGNNDGKFWLEVQCNPLWPEIGPDSWADFCSIDCLLVFMAEKKNVQRYRAREARWYNVFPGEGA